MSTLRSLSSLYRTPSMLRERSWFRSHRQKASLPTRPILRSNTITPGFGDNMISVLVVDDDKLVSECVSLCLEQQPDFLVIGTATTGREAFEKALDLRPDVMLLDYRIPGANAGEVLAMVRRERPQQKVLIFSAWTKPDYLARAIIHGADGYLTKDIGLSQLVSAVRQVAIGSTGYGRDTIEAAIDVIGSVLSLKSAQDDMTFEADELTIQESRILTLLAEGLSNREIESLIELRESTVKTHVRNILRKIQVPDRTKAAVWAYENGVIQVSS